MRYSHGEVGAYHYFKGGEAKMDGILNPCGFSKRKSDKRLLDIAPLRSCFNLRVYNSLGFKLSSP
jgi:hypothetical protein